MLTIATAVKQVDGSFRPLDRKTSGPYRSITHGEFPTLVIKVTTDEEDLTRELALWVSDATTVNVAIGVKITPVSRQFLMFMRSGQCEHYECDLHLITNECLQIPRKLLLDHNEDDAQSPVILDLHMLKSELDAFFSEK